MILFAAIFFVEFLLPQKLFIWCAETSDDIETFNNIATSNLQVMITENDYPEKRITKIPRKQGVPIIFVVVCRHEKSPGDILGG